MRNVVPAWIAVPFLKGDSKPSAAVSLGVEHRERHKKVSFLPDCNVGSSPPSSSQHFCILSWTTGVHWILIALPWLLTGLLGSPCVLYSFADLFDSIASICHHLLASSSLLNSGTHLRLSLSWDSCIPVTHTDVGDGPNWVPCNEGWVRKLACFDVDSLRFRCFHALLYLMLEFPASSLRGFVMCAMTVGYWSSNRALDMSSRCENAVCVSSACLQCRTLAWSPSAYPWLVSSSHRGALTLVTNCFGLDFRDLISPTARLLIFAWHLAFVFWQPSLCACMLALSHTSDWT